MNNLNDIIDELEKYSMDRFEAFDKFNDLSIRYYAKGIKNPTQRYEVINRYVRRYYTNRK